MVLAELAASTALEILFEIRRGRKQSILDALSSLVPKNAVDKN